MMNVTIFTTVILPAIAYRLQLTIVPTCQRDNRCCRRCQNYDHINPRTNTDTDISVNNQGSFVPVAAFNLWDYLRIYSAKLWHASMADSHKSLTQDQRPSRG